VNAEKLNIAFVLDVFQEQREILGPGYAFVGHPAGVRSQDAERTLVYLSLGSIFTDDVDLFRVCIRAFGRLARPCLVAIGRRLPPEALGPIPDNVRLEPFVDQQTVLGSAAVFITMGGMASVHEAIAAETPMIIIPELPEQQLTAARCETLGIATSLDRRAITEETLVEAIARTLESREAYVGNLRTLNARRPLETPARIALAHIREYLAEPLALVQS
jgi:MGT family glycosyltransferase